MTRAASTIGRQGPLALALGVGVLLAVAGAGSAAADTSDGLQSAPDGAERGGPSLSTQKGKANSSRSMRSVRGLPGVVAPARAVPVAGDLPTLPRAAAVPSPLRSRPATGSSPFAGASRADVGYRLETASGGCPEFRGTSVAAR